MLRANNSRIRLGFDLSLYLLYLYLALGLRALNGLHYLRLLLLCLLLFLLFGLCALLLFLTGAAFGFFLLMPNTIRISIELAENFDLGFMWTVGKYYTTLTWLVLGVGASFEFPLVIVLLVWIGVLSTDFLRKYRRHAIVLIFILAAVITPTPDPITQSIFAVPLYVLFEVAIIVGSRIEKRKAADLAAL